MKKYTFLLMFICLSAVGFAYQAGKANRVNYPTAQQQPPSNYRSFSNYNNRSWGQGVKISGVQTSVAGSEVSNLEEQAVARTSVQKQAAPVGTNATKPSAVKPAMVQPPTAPSTAPVAQETGVDPSAMMQQMQGMMQAVTDMSNATNAAGVGQTAPVAMPDISALMGGNLPKNVPVK